MCDATIWFGHTRLIGNYTYDDDGDDQANEQINLLYSSRYQKEEAKWGRNARAEVI